MTLGASPPLVCICGHSVAEHGNGYCDADTYRAEIGRSFGCFCPAFFVDADRRQRNKRVA